MESRLDQLHGDLRSDEKTLRLLDSALKGGTLSEQTAVYVRDVAKLLSETNLVKVSLYFFIPIISVRREIIILEELCFKVD